MRYYDYSLVPQTQLLTPSLVFMLTSLHEHKGKQELFLEAEQDSLSSLLEVAKIQSTGASNRIEGIYTSDKRLEELVKKRTAPENRSEQEIAGYREVLTTIQESYDHIDLTPGIILQLHRDLYSFSEGETGGHYKIADNVIAETVDGESRVRFRPVPAFQVSEAMIELCDKFNKSWNSNVLDKLLLIPMFVLDFLCIHPFSDGNGRMSRLLTLLLLYKAGYIAGKYISIEAIIEQTKETYYETLQDSSFGWHENENRYEPFVGYYLGILEKTHKDFESRIRLLRDKNLSKPDRIRAVIESKLGKVTKKDILDTFPDISITTVERTLKDLLTEGYIKKVGSGPATGYVKIK